MNLMDSVEVFIIFFWRGFIQNRHFLIHIRMDGFRRMDYVTKFIFGFKEN